MERPPRRRSSSRLEGIRSASELGRQLATGIIHSNVLFLGLILTAIGLAVAYDSARARPGETTRPGWTRTVGRVRDAGPAAGVLILGPAPNVPPSYWIEYAFRVDGAQFGRREQVREDYVVRVRGLSRRLGSFREGEEVPVWYDPGAPVESTLMPSAVVGTVLPRHLGWTFVLVGLTLVVIQLGAT